MKREWTTDALPIVAARMKQAQALSNDELIDFLDRCTLPQTRVYVDVMRERLQDAEKRARNWKWLYRAQRARTFVEWIIALACCIVAILVGGSW